MDADVRDRGMRSIVARQMGQGLRHAVDEGFGADKAVIGQHVGAKGHMLAPAKADFEMQRAVLAEQALGRHFAFERHGDLGQQRVDQTLLSGAQGLAL
jgi:hypothetical protein